MSGYTRQSVADIIPTAVVRAAPINSEYDKLRDAFAHSTTGTTGHKHDGTSDEGSYVPLIADLDAKNKIAVDTANNRHGVFVEVSSSAVEQVRFQDGVIVPVTDNDIDLGTSSLEFKDLYLDGTATIDTLQVDESATITANLTVNGNTTLGDAATDTVTVTADVASPLIPSTDDTYDLGAVGSEWRDLYIDGTANIDSLVADTADINAGTIDNTVIGGTTAAAADFTTMDASGNATVGGTFAVTGATTLSSTLAVTGATGIDGDFDINTNKFTVASASGNTAIAGTLGVTGASTLTGNATVGGTLGVTGAATLSDNLTVSGNATVGGNLTVNGTLNTLNTTNTVISDTLIELGNGVTGTPTNDSGIVIERGSADNAFIGFDESADKFIMGTGSFTGASTGDLTVTKGTLQASIEYDTISDGTITVTGFVDEDDMVSDSATLIPTQQSVKAYVQTIAGQSNNVVGLTATATELNKLDASAVTPSTVTLAASDGFVINDISATETKVALISDIDTYVSSSTATLTNKTLTSPTITSPTVTGLHLDDSGFTVEGSSADGNETTVAFTNPTADRTITIPDATGTVLLDANIGSTVQAYDAQLADVAGLTPTEAHAIVGDGSNFISTSSSTSSLQLPAGTTAQRTGSPVNGMLRYNSTDGAFEGYAAGAWGAIGGGGDTQTATTTSTTQTAIATYALADALGAEATIVCTDTVATERTITKLLITHDGTTAVATQYGEVNTATAMATYDVDISGGNVRILATAASANSTNFIVNTTLLA